MRCVECGREMSPPKPTGRPRRYCSRSCQSKAYRRRQDEGRFAVVPRGLDSTKSDAPLLKVAMALADAGGIDAVSLRTVAHQAHTPLASVQRTFLSRDRLVIAMVQHIFGRQHRKHRDSNAPQDALIRLAQQEWAAYRAQPWLVTVMARTRPPLAPAVVALAEQYVEAFRVLGLDSDTALSRYLALNAYIQGMALLLVSEDRETTRAQKSPFTWWSDELRRLQRTGSPRSAHWIAGMSSGKVIDLVEIEKWFNDGLERVIAGLLDDLS